MYVQVFICLKLIYTDTYTNILYIYINIKRRIHALLCAIVVSEYVH